MAERPFTWYEIPAGTKPSECRGHGCGAAIYFIPSRKTPGKSIPISVEPDGAFGPTQTEPGRGISHFQDCPAVGDFQRGGRRS